MPRLRLKVKSPTYSKFEHWGVVADLPPEEVAPERWTAVSNMQFQEEATFRVGGYERFSEPLSGSGPLFALNVLIDQVSWWIYCTATEVYVTDGVNSSDITPAAGLQTSEAGDWSGCILNGVAVLNNTKDAPFYWPLSPSAICLPLPGWPTNSLCKAMRAFKYHLFALGVTDNGVYQPDTIWWSTSAVPGAIPATWVPAPDNDAGDMTLADTPGAIVDGLSLRDSLVVYKQFACYVLTYVAGQYVYVQRKLFLTTGMQGLNCVAEINGEHWLFTGDDVIRHDGQNYRSVVQDKVKLQLTKAIDPTKKKMVCISPRVRDQQVWVCIPTQGQTWLNKAYVINTGTEDVGNLDLPQIAHAARGVVTKISAGTSWASKAQTWAEYEGAWDEQLYSPSDDSLLLCAPAANHLFNHNAVDTADGEPIYAYCERQSLPISDPIARALITRLVPRVDGQAGEILNIRVGGQAFYGEPIAWSPAQPFTIGQDVAVNVQTEGRLISVRFEGTTNKKWVVHSYTLGAVDLGLY